MSGQVTKTHVIDFDQSYAWILNSERRLYIKLQSLLSLLVSSWSELIMSSSNATAAVRLLKQRLSRFGTMEGVNHGLSFKPRSDDVFVVTPPKCGTTWMQQILHQLRSGGDMAFKEISDVVPHIEAAYDTEIDLEAEHEYRPR